MMYKIEAIGMRKKQNKILIISIIIVLIMGISACIAVYFHDKQKIIEVSQTEISETKGLNSGSSINVENNTANIQNQQIQTNQPSQENQTQNKGQDALTPEINNNQTTSHSQATTVNQPQEQKQIANENKQKNFINAIDNIYNGTEGKRVFLTFDDGPTPEVTPHILDTLKKYNIKATFFVLGNRVESNPELVKRAYDEGHYIANHGYSHKYKNIYKNVSSILDEYNKTENAIRNAIGNQNYSSHLFRFPGGSHGGTYEKIKKKARKELKKDGIAYLDWSALTYDAEGADTKKEVLNNLKTTINGWDNVVILMHDSADKKITYETLEDVIKYLQKKGYKFENMYDLMEE